MNFYKHHIGDYDAHTSHLSWTEDLVYRRLLSAYYLREHPLPADFPVLCRLVRAVEAHQKTALRRVLSEFFTLHAPETESTTVMEPNGVLLHETYHNERADMEIQQYQAQCAVNRRTTRQRIVKRNAHESSTNRSPNQNQIPEYVPECDVPSGQDDPDPNEINSYLSQQTSRNPKGNGAWWKTNQGIDAKATELGISAKPGEGWPQLKQRCFDEINQLKSDRPAL